MPTVSYKKKPSKYVSPETKVKHVTKKPYKPPSLTASDIGGGGGNTKAYIGLKPVKVHQPSDSNEQT